MRSGRILIFVFNFDRGNLSAIKDYSQKRTSDRDPECNLFALISTPVGIKKGWKRYIQQLRLPARFVHHDEYEEEFGALLTPLPAVFLHDQKARSLFISADEIRMAGSLDDLIVLVNQKLRSLS
ncbi:MAG TPA: hypothetical protein VLL74_01735 [Methanoregula sp.]|nr:hypothetical protein [Methanoregula sp.]